MVHWEVTGAQLRVTLRSSALVFLTANVYALIHLLTLFWCDSARLTGSTVNLSFLTLTWAFDSRICKSSYLRDLSGTIGHLVVSRFWRSFFLTSYHLFFHMLNTLLSNYLSSSWPTLSTMRSAYALSSHDLRLLLLLGSLIQYSIWRSSTGIIHWIIHLISSNWWLILVLNCLITSISTLSRFWFIATRSHLTSTLTLPRGRWDSVRCSPIVGWTHVLSTIQVVAGTSIRINGVITRL